MPTGRKPKEPGTADQRNTKFVWQFAEGVGWQHGDLPEPPDGLKAESIEAWNLWFGAWFAAFWTLEDLPGLRIMVELYDKVRSGGIDSGKLLPYLDRYGVTVKGQQDNRWAPPAPAEPEAPAVPDEVAARRADRSNKIA